MRYGSLFTGIGGFDLAFNRAGMECAWMCEIDKNCQDVLKKQFEGVRIYDDIREVGRGAEPVDLICGGFPCQDLSVAGKRAGLAGERSGLWFEFARVIDELEPQWVVIENVPGLLSSNKGKDFAVIIQWLAERGYGVAWRILDAQYFGVPQRRRRVFIVGSLGDGRASEVLFESESSPRDTAPSRETGERVANDAPTSTLRGFGHGWQGQHNDTNPVIAHAVTTHQAKMGDPTTDNYYISGMAEYKEGKGTLRSNGGDNGGGSEILVVHETGKGFWSKGLPGLRGQPGGMPENIIAYNIQQNDGGEHKRKDRPDGGLYVNETNKALTVGGTDKTVIAFSAGNSEKSHGIGAEENVSPPLKAGESGTNRVPTIAYGLLGETTPKFSEEIMPTLRSGNDNTGEQHQFVAFQQNQRDEVRDIGNNAGSINSEPGMHNQNFIAQPLRSGRQYSDMGDGQSNIVPIAWHENKQGNLTPSDHAKALRSGASHSYQGIGVRRLTPTECERLQGFPDGYTAGQSDSTRYRQLGNAVAVPVVRWIAERIMKVNERGVIK